MEVLHQAVVLQAEGVLIFPAAIAVTKAAGLGAAAPVAGAAADDRGQIALAGIAHTQRAVTKHFDLNGAVGTDIADLVPVQLPAEYHSCKTPGSA